jgi:formylglycine-generating enzyme required for sulfatase activity
MVPLAAALLLGGGWYFVSSLGSVLNYVDASVPISPREDCPKGMLPIRGLCLDQTEVTVASYRACVDAKVCKEPDARSTPFCSWGQPDHDMHPVSCVSFDQASTYCRWAGARLPFEDEWAVAAGAFENRFPWGDSLLPNPEKRLNACDLECGKLFHSLQRDIPTLFNASDGFATTAPVGSFPLGSSPFGVLDMAGNVAEWTEGLDGAAVIHGGSWRDSSPEAVSSLYRTVMSRDSSSEVVGFRCAKPLAPDAERTKPEGPR